jgi:hypothetical protein
LWTPTQAGTYDIRARFLGDAITSSNISSTLAVVVRQVSSTVSIGVTPSSVSLGSSASIAGKIDPSRSSVQVTVYYRLSGGEWASLPATSTDAQGNYAVEWQPTETGTYEVQAKWAGDVNTAAAESEIAELTVQGDGGIPFYTWYIVIGIIVVAAVVVAVYFLKFRKTK